MRSNEIGLLTLLLVACVYAEVVRNVSQEARLIKYLLLDYEVAARPVTDFKLPLNLTLDVALNQIFDLDERNQLLKTSVWLRMKWLDETLVWNSSDFGGLQVVGLSSARIWLPDLTLYNNAGVEYKVGQDMQVKVTSDGQVSWNTPAMLESSCKVDVSYFPFDVQYCNLTFGSWVFNGWQINLMAQNTTGDVAAYVNNGEWFLVDFPVKRNVEIYTCCPEPYIDLTYTIVIERRSLYYVFNLVFPVVLITLLTMLDFYLPPESGEKVSLGVTVLLAMTVFLLIIAENMPPTSEVIPLIGMFFGATIVMLGLSTSMTVMVLNLHFRGSRGKPVPGWMKKIVFGFLSRVLCMSFIRPASTDPCLHVFQRNSSGKKLDNGYSISMDAKPLTAEYESVTCESQLSTRFTRVDSSDSNSVLDELLRKVSTMEKIISSKLKDDQQEEDIHKEWQLVAMVIDRLFLILFFTATLVVWIAILVNRPASTFS